MMNLRPQRKNANKHSEHGLRLLEKSLQQDGWIDAQTIAADGEMISGSARLEVAGEKFADVEPIIVESDGTRPVIVKRTDIPNADDPRARRLSVAANQIAATDWNPDGELLKEWGNEDKDIRAMFADSEWEEMTGEEKQSKDAEPQIDRAAELLEKWQVKTGDLWQIGEHRLICGDCTDAAVVARVMGENKIDIVFTSPPYNSGDVAMRGGGNFSFAKKGADTLYTDFKDDMTPEDYYHLCVNALVNISLHVQDNHAVFWNVSYNANSRSDYGKIVFSADNPFSVQETIVWDKCHALPITSVGIFSRISEIIFLMSRGEKYLTNQKIGEQSVYWNTWRISSIDSQDSESHKACFPVKLPIKAIEDFTQPEMIVFDPFCGYGTVLVACQNTKRIGRGVELSPAYVSATLERMAQAFPGIEIKRLE